MGRADGLFYAPKGKSEHVVKPGEFRFAAAGLRSSTEKKVDIAVLKELMETGRLRSVIDRHYPLAETAEAHRYLEAGHAHGKVAIAVDV